MPIISSQVLAMIRRVTETSFSDTCLIERESNAVGTYGEPTHQWEVTAADKPCRLISVGARRGSGIAEAGAAESLEYEYRLIVAQDVTLAVDMRVTIAALVYNVVRIEDALTDEAYHSAILQRRD